MRRGIRALELSGRLVCVHAALRSFGHVEGGADTVVDAFLAEECTLLVPAFSSMFVAAPPAGRRPPRNGFDYERGRVIDGGERVDTTASDEVDRSMGAIPAPSSAAPVVPAALTR